MHTESAVWQLFVVPSLGFPINPGSFASDRPRGKNESSSQSHTSQSVGLAISQAYIRNGLKARIIHFSRHHILIKVMLTLCEV
jgi:hypothetical protein